MLLSGIGDEDSVGGHGRPWQRVQARVLGPARFTLHASSHALSRRPSVSPRRARLCRCIAALCRGLRRASSRGSRSGLLPQPSARTRTSLAYSARPSWPLNPRAIAMVALAGAVAAAVVFAV